MAAPPPYNAAPPPPSYQTEEPELPEIKMGVDRTEKMLLEKYADLFSIIKTCELLETAYIRDIVPVKEYQPACTKLISQFRTLRASVSAQYKDIDQFWKDFRIQCPAARTRLVVEGVPANIFHGASDSKDSSQDAIYIAQSVQHFITTMDSLKLNLRAIDELQPHLSELMDCLNKITSLPPDHISKQKVRQWLEEFNKLSASTSIDEAQARQFAFDLENAYTSFHKFLESQGQK